MTDAERKKYEQHLKEWEETAAKTYPHEFEWVKPNWHENYEGAKFKAWLSLPK